MGNYIVNEMNSLESWCRKNSRIDLLEERYIEKISIFLLVKSLMVLLKKHGGYVKKAIHGKQLSQIEEAYYLTSEEIK